MLSRRRLSLQLTPLLDLLLIVMFSQYIENRDRTAQAESARAADAAAVADKLASLEQQFAVRRAELKDQFDRDRQTVDELRQTYDQRFQSLIEQHHQVGTLLAQALNLPGAAMEEVLKLRSAGRPDDAERLSEAIKQLRQLMQARGEQVYRTLVRIDEVQKHVTVFEVHVQANGQALITDGQQTFNADFGSDDEFIRRLYEHSKSFAEPRTLIILLLSWGDAQAGQRQMAVSAMPGLVELLRKDAAGTRWYDFSIVGYRTEGPLVPASPVP
jgi:hypothetical protein